MASSISDWLRDVRFEDFLYDLETTGWFAYVFPFLIVYSVIFTILNKVEIFADKKPVKVIIALVFALTSVYFPISEASSCGLGYGGGHAYDGNCSLGDLMATLFPGVTAFSMGILALYIIAAMLGVDLSDLFGDGKKPNIVTYVLGGLGVLFVVYYFGLGFGWWDYGYDGTNFAEFFEDPLLYILIIFGLFFWYISKDDSSPKKKNKGTHVHVNEEN